MRLVNRWTSETLFEGDYATRKELLEAATKKGISMRGADLSSADLRHANLEGADLYGADFTHADLSGANLKGANLACAQLEYANLAGARMFGDIQICGHRHWMSLTREGSVQIGCHIFQVQEWQRHAPQLAKLFGYTELEAQIYRRHFAHLEEVAELLKGVR